MVRTPRSHCRGSGSIPGRGTKIPQDMQGGQKKKKKKEIYKDLATLGLGSHMAIIGWEE